MAKRMAKTRRPTGAFAPAMMTSPPSVDHTSDGDVRRVARLETPLVDGGGIAGPGSIGTYEAHPASVG